MNGATVAILGVLSAFAGLGRLLDLPGNNAGMLFLVVLGGGRVRRPVRPPPRPVHDGRVGVHHRRDRPVAPVPDARARLDGRRRRPRRRATSHLDPRLEVVALAAYAWTWGFLYGAIMNLWFWPFQRGGALVVVSGARFRRHVAPVLVVLRRHFARLGRGHRARRTGCSCSFWAFRSCAACGGSRTGSTRSWSSTSRRFPSRRHGFRRSRHRDTPESIRFHIHKITNCRRIVLQVDPACPSAHHCVLCSSSRATRALRERTAFIRSPMGSDAGQAMRGGSLASKKNMGKVGAILFAAGLPLGLFAGTAAADPSGGSLDNDSSADAYVDQWTECPHRAGRCGQLRPQRGALGRLGREPDRPGRRRVGVTTATSRLKTPTMRRPATRRYHGQRRCLGQRRYQQGRDRYWPRQRRQPGRYPRRARTTAVGPTPPRTSRRRTSTAATSATRRRLT